MEQFPLSVYKKIKSNRLFNKDHKISGNAEFYTADDIKYYVCKYSTEKEKKIKEGCLSLNYSINLFPMKLITNISSYEITEVTMPMVIVDCQSHGKFILYSKVYKNYLLTELDSIVLLESASNKRFEIR